MKGMLTRSQQWRRIVQKSKSDPELDIFLNLYEETNKRPDKIESAPQLGSSDLLGALDKTKAASSPSLSTPSMRKNKKGMCVSFSNVDRVILVPTRQEYIDHKLSSKLWWSEPEYIQFKKSAIYEISAIINIFRVDAKTALSKLANDEHLLETLQKNKKSPLQIDSTHLPLNETDICTELNSQPLVDPLKSSSTGDGAAHRVPPLCPPVVHAAVHPIALMLC